MTYNTEATYDTESTGSSVNDPVEFWKIHHSYNWGYNVSTGKKHSPGHFYHKATKDFYNKGVEDGWDGKSRARARLIDLAKKDGRVIKIPPKWVYLAFYWMF